MESIEFATCQEYLCKEYELRLGISVSLDIDPIKSITHPTWLAVSPHDLIGQENSKNDIKVGVLLDAELGLAAYILRFLPEDDLKRQVTWALKLRSTLCRNPREETAYSADSLGAWRVAMHWLVPESAKNQWLHQITELRSETAFSEEINFDAIFLNDLPLLEQLHQHGFPRLLFATREVLKKESEESISSWLSADSLVMEAVKTLSSGFRQSAQRANALAISEEAQRIYNRSVPATGVTPPTLNPFRKIKVSNFRNLKNFELDFGHDPVSARIIHGPNGTGKSSVCEAIALGLFGCSNRYAHFADRDKERDVPPTKRDTQYIDQYITPIDQPTAMPVVEFDGANRIYPSLSKPEGLSESLFAMSGTVLTQEASMSFARLTSDELGALVLRGYSDLAEQLEDYCERKVAEVQSARQDLLRSHGLSAAITKVDTALEKIAKAEIDSGEVSIPPSLAAWLRDCRTAGLSGADALYSDWLAWDDESQRKDLIKAVLKKQDRRSIKAELHGWIDQRNDLIVKSASYLEDLRSKLPTDLSGLNRNFKLICEWLEKQKDAISAPSNSESKTLKDELENTQNRETELTQLERELRTRAEHLAATEGIFDNTWKLTSSNECPTCGADHQDDGGIAKVVRNLRQATSRHVQICRDELDSLKSKIEELQRQLIELGQGDAPFTSKLEADVFAGIQWLVPSNVLLKSWLSDSSNRAIIESRLECLSRIPIDPQKLSTDEIATSISEKMLKEFDNAQSIFEGPANWLPVKDKLAETLARIVNEHLPNTLSRLWIELSLNLTAAPWLLPARPNIVIGTQKGAKKSSIEIQSRLARYILNEAEVHTLGLAWFFVKYLTHGRFLHSCLLFDDAAQQMDQTSFRDLCRLWETWIRLHRVYRKPLQLGILLNQESRALDAARATGGVLTVLGWTFEQDRVAKEVSFESRGSSLAPAAIFHRAAIS